MAILVPDIPKACTHTERQLFRRFERELADDTIVLHSLRLSGHDYKIWGEADFVIISPKGLFAIEVKGGSVSCTEGKWTITSPDGKQSYTKSESPFDQACSALTAVRKELAPYPLLKNILVGYGVVMPHEIFTNKGSEIVGGVLLDSREINRNLSTFIERLSRFWMSELQSKYSKQPRLLQSEDIRKIRHLLRPDVSSHFSIGSYITNIDNELIDLTAQQRRYVRGMQNNKRTIIEGHTGTGKTVLAVDRVLDIAKSGKKVLFLCFNKLLVQHVRKSLQSAPENGNITAHSVHAYFSLKIKAAGLESRLNSHADESELFGEIYPRAFLEAACLLELEQFDAVVVDEAQDLLTIPNLEAFDALLKDGIENGSWHLFMDPLQNIYGAHAESAMKWLDDIGYASYQLTENCRNTKQIAATTTLVSGLDVPAEGAVSGPPVEEIFYSDIATMLARLDHRVKELLSGGLHPGDLIILSANRYEHSELSTRKQIAGLTVVPIEQELPDDRSIHFATMHSFKGLERKVILAVSLHQIGNKSQSMLHYVGLSRARTLLILLLPETVRKTYASLGGAFATRLMR